MLKTCRDCNGDGVVDKDTDNEKGNNLRIEFDGALLMRKSSVHLPKSWSVCDQMRSSLWAQSRPVFAVRETQTIG